MSTTSNQRADGEERVDRGKDPHVVIPEAVWGDEAPAAEFPWFFDNLEQEMSIVHVEQ